MEKSTKHNDFCRRFSWKICVFQCNLVGKLLENHEKTRFSMELFVGGTLAKQWGNQAKTLESAAFCMENVCVFSLQFGRG